MEPFRDRVDAGRRLASAPELARHADDGAVVLALPRGGVPVAFEVASALHLPLDVFVVRKLGLPGRQELAMGAVASSGVVVLDREMISAAGVTKTALDAAIRDETLELKRREHAYRENRPAPDVAGRVVLLVDDGLATGASMRAAVRALAAQRPARVVVAVPVGALSSCQALAEEVDEVVCLRKPVPFEAVGLWYRDFRQTTDAEVRELLATAAARRATIEGRAR